jgi:hypothetical protein
MPDVFYGLSVLYLTSFYMAAESESLLSARYYITSRFERF